MGSSVSGLVDSKGCHIVSKQGYELHVSRGTINAIRWKSVFANGSIMQFFQDSLDVMKSKRPLRLTACGFGKKGGVLDKTQGRILACVNDKLYVYSGLGIDSCFTFKDPESDGYSIKLFSSHFSFTEVSVSNTIQDMSLRESQRLKARNPEGIFHPHSPQAKKFVRSLYCLMNSLPSSRAVLRKERIHSIILESLPNVGKNTVQVCYHHWFVKQNMGITESRSSERGVGVKIDMTQLAKLHTKIVSEDHTADAIPLDKLTNNTTIPFIHEDPILEEQDMHAQSCITGNQELQALLADLFAKHMQISNKMQDLQTRRNEQEAQRVSVRTQIAAQQNQETKFEKDIKELQVEIDNCQPILDKVRKEFVQAVKVEAEASSATFLAFQKDDNLNFLAAQATAHRTDTMNKVQEQQVRIDTARVQLQEKQDSYELVKQTRKNLDKQHEELYGEVQQMNRELSQMKSKVQATLSRKGKPETVAALELFRELMSFVTIVD